MKRIYGHLLISNCIIHLLVLFISLNYCAGGLSARGFNSFSFSEWVERQRGNEIQESLNGEKLREISSSSCSSKESATLRPSHIHLFMLDSNAENSFQKETFEYYAKVRGYHFKIVNPMTVIKRYGPIKPDSPGRTIIASKSLVMKYYMKEVFHTFGCQAHWVLFLDADVVFLNFNHSVESIIQYANAKVGGSQQNQCNFIAQMGPNTINSGFLLFKVSLEGEKVLSNWVMTHKYYSMIGTKWQDDQGWLQQTYLSYLESYMDIKFPIDCATMKKQNPSFPENTMRNLCFTRNLMSLNLLPAMRETGSYCMLPGLTAIDRFNIRDWLGETTVNETSGQVSFVPRIPYTSTGDGNVVADSGREHVATRKNTPMPKTPATCVLNDLFLYHGKDKKIVSALRGHWNAASGLGNVNKPYATYTDTDTATCGRELIQMHRSGLVTSKHSLPNDRGARGIGKGRTGGGDGASGGGSGLDQPIVPVSIQPVNASASLGNSINSSTERFIALMTSEVSVIPLMSTVGVSMPPLGCSSMLFVDYLVVVIMGVGLLLVYRQCGRKVPFRIL